MPVAYIDLPSGLPVATKKRLVKEVAESIHHAYIIPDTRVFLREWAAEHTSIDGVLGHQPMRPICTFVVPPGLPLDAKRKLVKQVSSAIAEACSMPQDHIPLPSGKNISTRWILGFFSEVPLDQASLDDLMAFENPAVLESMEAVMQGQKAPTP